MRRDQEPLPQPPIQYRPDIDGLRAVAVLTVLVFHAFPEALPGGFVGVDIFFVMSGFLISGIILKDLERGRFTFANFYSRRVRRIFPSLVLVLALVLAIGWFLLLPDEFAQLSKHTVAGAAFVSNLALWRESGYFDTAAQSKPLLHLWSLGIEEQYYIVWPLLLAFLWRRPKTLLRNIALLAVISFCLNTAFIRTKPYAVFYLPITRVWELIAGSALAWLSHTKSLRLSESSRQIVSVAGMALIAISLALTTEDSFPGWWALLPVASASLLVTAGPQAWINRHLLNLPWMVTIGLISYPLYLWHWPLLTYFRLVSQSDLSLSPPQSVLARLTIMGISTLLAWATWRFWEAPLRHAPADPSVSRAPILAAAMAGVALCGIVSVTGVITPRLNQPAVMSVVNAIADWDRLPNDNQVRSSFADNEIPSRSDRVTLFVGDSHVEQYWPRAKAAIRGNPQLASAVFATYPGCPPLPGLGRTEPGFRCLEFYNYWSTLAASPRVETIVIGAFWESYLLGSYPGPAAQNPSRLLNAGGRPATAADFEASWQALENTLRALAGSGKHVVILSSAPAAPGLDPRRVFHRFRSSELTLLQPVNRAGFDRYIAPVEARLLQIADRVHATLIRPVDYFCNNDYCPATDQDGAPMYKDENHLRTASVVQKATFIDKILQP